MTDVRRNKPSASGVERLSLCPGSWNLCQSLPPETASESEDAASGTRIHAALCGENSERLSDDDLTTFLACKDLEIQARMRVLGVEASETVTREKRLWLGDSFSGQYDFLAISGNKAVLLDYKTGRGEVESAEGNLQLRALACLVAKEHPELDEITVGIIQPWASPQLSLCRYGRGDLLAAEMELLQILDCADDPDAKRIPGEKQCRWCRGKLNCKELLDYLLAFSNDLECSKRNQPSPQVENA